MERETVTFKHNDGRTLTGEVVSWYPSWLGGPRWLVIECGPGSENRWHVPEERVEAAPPRHTDPTPSPGRNEK